MPLSEYTKHVVRTALADEQAGRNLAESIDENSALAQNVVTLTGSQVVAGVKTRNDRDIFDMSANATGLARQLIPSHSSSFDNVLWGEGISSFQVNGDGSYNQVFSYGWNVTAAGTALDHTKIMIRGGVEYRWKNPDDLFQSEWHIFCTAYPDEDGAEHRALTFATKHVDRTSLAVFSVSNFSIQTEAVPVGLPIHNVSSDGTANLDSAYWVNSIRGQSITLSPTADSFAFGRSTTPATQADLNGQNVRLNLNNDVSIAGFFLSSGSSDLNVIVNNVTSATILGEGGNTSVWSLQAPVDQAGGTGFNFGAGVSKSGSIRLDIDGHMRLYQSSGSYLFMGNSTQVFLDPSGNFFAGHGVTIPDGQDIALGFTTGTKIGNANTEKLSFWNATPVVQPPKIANADGTLPDVTSKFNSLLGQLQSMGLQAAA